MVIAANGNLFVQIVMFGWIPLVLLLFARLPPRRAALISVLAGWMFLPVAAYRIHGFPDYTKTFAVSAGVFLGILIFDPRRLIALRPRWVDIPVFLFCVSPFFSSIAAGLGMHDGLSVVFAQCVTWAVPYLVGLLYFRSLSGLRELATGILLGGLIYLPLCIFEILWSPRLHLWIYGFAQGAIDRAAMRLGGWRPMVFMNSGLAVAVWMAAASVIGIWLCKAGAFRSVRGATWLVTLLVLTTLWLKSANGWLLLVLGVILLMASAHWRNSVLVYATILLVPIYVGASATGWSRAWLIPLVKSVLSTDRAASLQYRFRNEEVVSANAREHPLLGWGRTSSVLEDRDRKIFPYGDRKTKSYAVVDSLWIAVFAFFGAIGLAGFLGSLLLPVTLCVWRLPAARWSEAELAPAAALAIVLLLYGIDDLANGFINPVFMLIAGGLANFVPGPEMTPRTTELR